MWQIIAFIAATYIIRLIAYSAKQNNNLQCNTTGKTDLIICDRKSGEEVPSFAGGGERGVQK